MVRHQTRPSYWIDASALNLERDIVVQVAAAGARGSAAHAAGAAGGVVAEAAAGIIALSGSAATAAVEHGQLAAEFLQHHFGRVFLLARLVGPFAGLQRALDIDLA